MSKQEELIGTHPNNEHYLGKWLTAEDYPTTNTKCHRALTESIPLDDDLVDCIARVIIKHHYCEDRINKLKEKYIEIGYPEYAKQHRKLPINEKVKKGNAVEILLTEYTQASCKKEFIKVFKLRYNPNVDQSMKGDDMLMVDLYEEEGIDKIKIYLGEAKFRSNPTKDPVEAIMHSLSKDKLPLSYTFLVDEIAKTNKQLADKLDNFIVEEVKGSDNLIYVGLLMSDTNTAQVVERHLNSDNPNLVFLSLGANNPENIINTLFNKAENLLANPELL